MATTTEEPSNMVASPAEDAVPNSSSVPDAAVVSIADALSHALDGNANQQHVEQQQGNNPPPALPSGWVLRESRTQPNYYFYYNYDTGVSTWYSPVVPEQQQLQVAADDNTNAAQVADAVSRVQSLAAEKAPVEAPRKIETKKRPHDGDVVAEESSGKKAKTLSSSSSSSGSGKPSKVRILHILKKHKDSRRPSSWRQSKITATKEEAIEELQGLVDILQEESGEAQRATFEELARTESDCSSAKRGGDLGFFGPKKMQPKFEEASFALQIGQLSGIVESSSGVHVLLRIG